MCGLKVSAEKRNSVTGDWTKVLEWKLPLEEMGDAEARVRCEVDGLMEDETDGAGEDGGGRAFRKIQFLGDYCMIRERALERKKELNGTPK